MNTRRAVWMALSLALAGTHAGAQGASAPTAAPGPNQAPPTADPSQTVGAPHGPALSGAALEQRTRDVAALLRCPVCQGLSVADSPSTMATNMRGQVRELVAAGYDQEQILAYFERSYGEFVRLQPPLRGVNWLVWLAPILGLLGGAGVVWWALRRPRLAADRLQRSACGRSGTGHASRRSRARPVRAARARARLRLAGRDLAERPRSGARGGVRRLGLAGGDAGGRRAHRLGAALVMRWRRGPAPASGPPPMELRDLDGRLDTLVGQLRELDDLASTRSPDQLARERYALELEAASTWRERERGGARVAPEKKAKGRAAAAPAPAAPDGLPGLAARAARVRVGHAHGRVARRAGLRRVAPGQTARRGRQPDRQPAAQGSRPRPPAADDETARCSAVLAQNPDDLDARLDLAQLHLRQRDLMGVWNETQYVLERAAGPAAGPRLPGAGAAGHGPARRRRDHAEAGAGDRPEPDRGLSPPRARVRAHAAAPKEAEAAIERGVAALPGPGAHAGARADGDARRRRGRGGRR